jgi:LysM repeat protein
MDKHLKTCELILQKMNRILQLSFSLILFFSLALALKAQHVSPKPHEISPGETFFSIARQYNVPVSELYKANPGVIADSIRPGQIVLIPVRFAEKSPMLSPESPSGFNPQPFTKSPKSIGVAQEKSAAPSANAPSVGTSATALAKSTQQDEQVLYHLVEEKQTLYAIARSYGVAVEDIVKWNQLPDQNIQIGMKLLIKTSAVVKTQVLDQPVTTDTLKDPLKDFDAKSIATHKSEVPANGLQDQLYQNFLDAKSRGAKEYKERQSISWLKSNNERMGGGYFALHKSAPVGTIIKVTNLVSKKYVFVKVIGKLPESADNINVAMRMSGQAQKDLQLNGDKAYVELEYYP